MIENLKQELKLKKEEFASLERDMKVRQVRMEALTLLINFIENHIDSASSAEPDEPTAVS